MSNVRNLIDKQFGRLTVTGIAHVVNYRAFWRCRCVCGNDVTIRGDHLTCARVKSCGCLNSEIVIARNRAMATHRKTNTIEYRAWANMKDRCYRKTHKQFSDYGGRGIKVCARWRNSFESFLADMGLRPPGVAGRKPLYSIDRYPNPNGNYKPTNCRWATKYQQTHNRRTK